MNIDDLDDLDDSEERAYMAKVNMDAMKRDERFRLASLIGALGGDPRAELSRLKPLFSLAEKLRKDRQSPPPAVDIVALAVTLRDVGVTDEDKVMKAMSILDESDRFLNSRGKKITEVYSLQRMAQWPWDNRPAFEIPGYMAEFVADLNLGADVNFEAWLKIIMPGKPKRRDRVDRLTRYIRENGNLFSPPKMIDGKPVEPIQGDELVAYHLGRIEKLFTPHRVKLGTNEFRPFNPEDPEDRLFDSELTKVKQATLRFMAWDRSQSAEDRKTRATKAANARYEK